MKRFLSKSSRSRSLAFSSTVKSRVALTHWHIQRNLLTASSAQPREPVITDKQIHINDLTYPVDNWTNVSQHILEKTTRRLHLHPSHPISIIRGLIENHFATFTPFNSFHPAVTTKQNFDDLGFPPDHIARKMSDNYYLNASNMLRAHTSAHQLQGLRSGSSRFLISGDVYRRDEIDASHYPVFHQMEGFRYFDIGANVTPAETQADIASIRSATRVITSDTTIITPSNPLQPVYPEVASTAVISHLKNSLNSMVEVLFRGETELQVRWIDAYFPFTSPSWEMEIFYDGQWMEICGCGIVKQDIMNAAGLNDKIAWAFGLGLERLAMALFGIPDIRLFWSTDERFLGQFTNNRIVKFKPFSKFPPCVKDMSFWVNEQWNENDFCEIIRGIAGDLVENVKLVDDFKNPKTNRRSLCYRIIYRSMDRTVTNEEINDIQEVVRVQVRDRLNIELR